MIIHRANRYRKLNPAFLTLASKAHATATPGSGGGGTPAPAHFWPMTEGSGSVFVDHAGATNLNFANPGWIAPPSGMGSSASIAAFSAGLSSAQASAVVANLNFSGLTPFTVSVWAYPLTNAAFTICGNLNAPASTYEGWEFTNEGTGTGLLLVNNVGTNQMSALNAVPLTPSAAVHLVITYTGSLTIAGVKEYVNGSNTSVTDSTGTLSSSLTSTIPFLIGARAGGTNYYNGYMAYLRTWNVQLTPAQVAALYAAGPQ